MRKEPALTELAEGEEKTTIGSRVRSFRSEDRGANYYISPRKQRSYNELAAIEKKTALTGLAEGEERTTIGAARGANYFPWCLCALVAGIGGAKMARWRWRGANYYIWCLRALMAGIGGAKMARGVRNDSAVLYHYARL